MSTIIIITPKPKPKLTVAEAIDDTEGTKVRVVVEDTGSMADRLRAAADLLDGLS